MTIYFVGIYYKLNNSNAFRVFAWYDLNEISYFKRSYAKDFIHLLAREFVKSRDANETFSTMEHNHSIYNYQINIMTENNTYYYIIITNIDYDIKVARFILCEIATEFKKYMIINKLPKYIFNDMNIENSFLNLLIEKHKNDVSDNKINKIKEDLNSLTDLMKNNIDKIIVRDFKLNELLDKSKNVSEQANEFRKSASKLNKCCGWW